MTEGERDPAAYQWLKTHAGVLSAIVLLVIVLVGIVLGIVGTATGNGDLGDNGWAMAVVAALFGGVLRFGYHIGRRARPDSIETQLARMAASLANVEHAVTDERRASAAPEARRQLGVARPS